MSRVGNMIYEIQEDLDAGILSFGAIAEKHDVPSSWVEVVYREYVPQMEYNE